MENYTYKKIGDGEGGINVRAILRSDGACIPTTDSNNTDYQEYLKWVAEGNTIEEAD